MKPNGFDPEKFAKMYEANRERAILVLTEWGYSRDLAEDAVQSAAEYFLKTDHPRVTPSLFIKYARRRASNIHEAMYGCDRQDKHGRPKGKQRFEVCVGSSSDIERMLSTPPVFTSEEG